MKLAVAILAGLLLAATVCADAGAHRGHGSRSTAGSKAPAAFRTPPAAHVHLRPVLRWHAATMARPAPVIRTVPVVRRVIVTPVYAPAYLPISRWPAYPQPITVPGQPPQQGYAPAYIEQPPVSTAATEPASAELEVRYYCPDSGEYYPAVSSCASNWLKVLTNIDEAPR